MIENVTIALMLAIYGALVFFRVPEYHREIIPLVIRFYGALNCGTSYLFQHPYTKLCVLAIVAFFVIPTTANNREIRRVLLMASMSLLIIAFVQRKGFYYHFYPAAAISVLLLAVIFLDCMETVGLIRRLAGPRKSVTVLVMLLALLALAGAKLVRYWHCTEPPLLSPLIRLVHEHADRKPILLLSSSNFPAFPLVNYTGANWSSRFPCLWLLPGFYRDVCPSERGFPYHARDQMDPIERFFVNAVISDLLSSPPVLLIVDSSEIKQGFGRTNFDYIEYFLQDPRFVQFWTSYEFLTSVDSYRVFKLKKAPLPT